MRASRPLQREATRFLGTLLLLTAGAFVLLRTTLFQESIQTPSLELSASFAASLLQLTGEPVAADGKWIQFAGKMLSIERGCDAIEPFALFAAAVLATPAQWRARAIGVVLGAVALFALNQLRIITLALALAYWPEGFEVLHLDVWQALFIGAGLGLWLLWAHGALRAELAAYAP